MTTDQFKDVSRVVGASFPARMLRQVVAGVSASAPRSAAGAAFIQARAGLTAISPTDRVRLTGVLLLTAAVTYDALVGFLPRITRPGVPRALGVAVALAGLAMMLIAPALERAWRTSTIRGKFLSQSVR